jgi:hypothetical protein
MRAGGWTARRRLTGTWLGRLVGLGLARIGWLEGGVRLVGAGRLLVGLLHLDG